MKKRLDMVLDDEMSRMIKDISNYYKLETRNGKVNFSATIREIVRRTWNVIQDLREAGLG